MWAQPSPFLRSKTGTMKRDPTSQRGATDAVAAPNPAAPPLNVEPDAQCRGPKESEGGLTIESLRCRAEATTALLEAILRQAETLSHGQRRILQ